jgi:hypothetical protein
VQKEKCKSQFPCKFLVTLIDVCLAVTVTMQFTSAMSQRGLASYAYGINILQQLSYSSPRTNDRIAMVDPCIETDCSSSFGRNIEESKAVCDNDLTAVKNGPEAKMCVNHEIGDGHLS